MFEETVTVWYVALLPNLVQSSPLAPGCAGILNEVRLRSGRNGHSHQYGVFCSHQTGSVKARSGCRTSGTATDVLLLQEDVGLRQPEPEPQPVKKIQKETINEVLTKKRKQTVIAGGTSQWNTNRCHVLKLEHDGLVLEGAMFTKHSVKKVQPPWQHACA